MLDGLRFQGRAMRHEVRGGNDQRWQRGLALAGALAALAGAVGCAARAVLSPQPAVVPELYESERYPADNIDSLAVWAPGRWLVCTSKSTDRLLVFDTGSGRLVREFGTSGEGPGNFRRPNGVAVVGDLALVVERDNRRVQVLHLPDLEPLGMVGVGELRNPYGLAAFAGPGGAVELYVTDSYLDAGGAVPAPAALNERVKHFRLVRAGDGFVAELVRAFGDTRGAGVLRLVESIAVDPVYRRLLVADEHEAARDIKVYDLEGRFTGVVLGRGHYASDPEGIALVTCGTGGWWVTTDQRQQRTLFHLYDRQRLAYAGAFVGRRVANTDGIAVAGVGCAAHPGGALFAVDDDQAVAAFAWSSVAAALGLSASCGRQPDDAPRDALD